MTTIPRLLFRTCPSAIAGFVVAIILDSIQICVLGPRTHIRQKCFEGAPPVTNCNSPASVVAIPVVSGIQASLSHVEPGIPFPGATFAVSRHCLGLLAGNLFSQTTATPDLSPAEFIAADGFEGLAFTLANPISRPVLLLNGRSLYNQQSTKGLSFQVN